MFNRSWIRVIAFVGILIVGVGLIPDSGKTQTNLVPSANQQPAAAQNQTQSQPGRETTALPLWFEKAEEIWRAYISKSETAASDDQRRQNSDLDAQWAMAYAAIAMALFTFMQLFVTGATLLYLKWTFAENKKAANASIRAADSAQRSAAAAEIEAKDTRQNFENTERPYIYIFGPKLFLTNGREVGGLNPWAEYCVGNFGRTPATCESILCEMIVLEADKPSPPASAPPDNPVVVNPVFEPGRRYDATRIRAPDSLQFFIGTAAVTPMVLPTERIYLQIWIRYRGPFSRGYETRASWIWDNSVSQFVRFQADNPEFNGMT
jgi:hypothetical protein